MKKKLAVLLAFCLMLNAFGPVFATESSSHPENEASVTSDSAPESDDMEAPDFGASSDSSFEDPSADYSEDADDDDTDGSDGMETELSSDDSTEAQDMWQENSENGDSVSPEEDTPEAVALDEPAPVRMLSDFGQVRVQLVPALAMGKDITFDVRLDGPRTAEDELKLQPDEAMSQVLFENLPDGEYTLSVSGEAFVTYQQTFSIAHDGAEILLATGFLGGMDYEAGSHPGVLKIGDVNGDDTVDDADLNAILDVIDTEESGGITDLSGDGVTDLADLEYFVVGYEEESYIATVNRFVPTAALSASVDANTALAGEGTMEQLLRQEASVQLSPQNGEPISADNPVSISIDFAGAQDGEPLVTDGIVIETGEDTFINQATIDIEYTDESGELQTAKVPVEAGILHFTESDIRAEIDSQGNIRVHLGGQVAVKKVKLSIQNVSGGSLAEISKVEFVNGMENRIPEPEMNIPHGLTAVAGSEQFSVSWNPEVNVTGYEALVWMEENPDAVEKVQLIHNSLEMTSFLGKDVKNLKTYRVKVRSVNGSWHSDYSEEIAVTPKPQGRPDKPDNVKAVGYYQSISVTWKDMDDTQSYNLSYRIKGSGEAYTEVKGLTTNKYQILGLADLTTYEIFVQGVNELGISDPSLLAEAKTTDMQPTKMPRYKLINVPEEPGTVSPHIADASHLAGDENIVMYSSILDEGSSTSAWGTVDNNPASYYSRSGWNDGGAYSGTGLTFTFDQAYDISAFAFTTARSVDNVSPDPYTIRVRHDGAPKDGLTPSNGVTFSRRTDADGRAYFFVQLPEKVTTKTISFGLSIYPQQGDRVSVSEVYFYHYDSLWDDIMDLYEDDLHTVLRPEVGEAEITELRGRLEETDPISGEKHYDYDQLAKELDNAEAILNARNLSPSVVVHNGIVMDINRGFGGINDWQPLGVTAAAGEKITVYVGHSTRKTGQNTQLELVFTQYHAESGEFFKTQSLKIGANSIEVPKIASFSEQESGGALYVRYTGSSSAKEQYAVRVDGGVQVPKLDLYGVTDREQRLERVRSYLTALAAYEETIEKLHAEKHEGEASVSQNVNKAFRETDCILGATDILMDTMMYSIPVQQVISGSGGNAETMLTALEAMEEMLELFYQHKGLNHGAAELIDRIPAGHLNIRYMRMFGGAFMYASGNHIGVEYTETDDLVSCGGLQSTEDGRYISGNYFGWGFAHEIGHDINQGAYAVAEITNNYFAQLAQAQDRNEGMRWQDYQKVYDKVTSGVKGDCPNIAVQLAMYWQLHLAYDTGYNYKTYTDYEEQLKNLFYARMDTYARTRTRADALIPEGGIPLDLEGADTDQALMRLACAAAEKNILPFFERWGKVPNAQTRAYAEQFPAETRAIWYANDDSRVYALTHGGSSLKEDGTTPAVTEAMVEQDSAAGNKVNLTFANSLPEGDFLGYEIVRVIYASDDDVTGAVVEKTPVGFTTTDRFTDTVLTINNRAVYYEITAVDQYLHRSAVYTTNAVKIQHEGDMAQTGWSLEATDMEADMSDAEDLFGDEDTKDHPEKEDVFLRAIDDDTDTVLTLIMKGSYDAEAAMDPSWTGGNIGFGPYLRLDFGRYETVSGFRYTPSAQGTEPPGYAIYLSTPDKEWKAVASGSFEGSGPQTVYFENTDGKYIAAYKANALIFVPTGLSEGASFSVAELDVLGATGDNVDFRSEENAGKPLIGILDQDYVYEESSGDKIPKGSLIFMGAYKGNAAYNVVTLYDENGRLVVGTDGESNQVILADVPEGGPIQDVRNGTWVYWLEPGTWTRENLPKKVRAELYRVNDAKSNEGQRLVSDTLFVDVPGELENITLGE